jgi:hypothetical protein
MRFMVDHLLSWFTLYIWGYDLTERTFLINGNVFKGPKWNFFFLRDQNETKNIFKETAD